MQSHPNGRTGISVIANSPQLKKEGNSIEDLCQSVLLSYPRSRFRRDCRQMVQDKQYNRGGHTKFSLKVHVILVTKYRKKLFQHPDVIRYLKQTMQETASVRGASIIIMETDLDHIHMMIEYSPSLCISDLVSWLKQYSTQYMWHKYAGFLRRCYWKHKNLWSDGYFACSIGEVSANTIRQYIANQG